MNAARLRLRRLGRATGVWTRSASSDCIVRAVSFGPGPLGIEPAVDALLAATALVNGMVLVTRNEKGMI